MPDAQDAWIIEILDGDGAVIDAAIGVDGSAVFPAEAFDPHEPTIVVCARIYVIGLSFPVLWWMDEHRQAPEMDLRGIVDIGQALELWRSAL